MPRLTVVALCAAWCHVCTGFQPLFERLARARAGDRLEWVDIEDEADALGELEVEDFPTLAVFDGGELLHFGAIRAEEGAVGRLLEALAAKAGPGRDGHPGREEILARLREVGRAR